jgi:hypothetical protein
MFCQAKSFTRVKKIDFHTNRTNLCWWIGKNHNLGKLGENEKKWASKVGLVELFE